MNSMRAPVNRDAFLVCKRDKGFVRFYCSCGEDFVHLVDLKTGQQTHSVVSRIRRVLVRPCTCFLPESALSQKQLDSFF